MARKLKIMENEKHPLDGGEAYTQSQVAGMLGISRSYVSRIEKRAVIKISKNII